MTYLTPLLDAIYDSFSADRRVSLPNTYLFACQHIRKPREVLLSKLLQFGFRQDNIYLLGKAYSTNQKLLQELRACGYSVIQPAPRGPSFDQQHAESCRWMFRRFLQIVPSGSDVIVLDDGGELLKTFNTNFHMARSRTRVFGIEQTSSGFRLLENTPIRFPIINVARSQWKLEKENLFIAAACVQAINEYFDKAGVTPKRFLVIGSRGPIGSALVDLLYGAGAVVCGFDLADSSTSLMSLIKAVRPEVIIGATGVQSITEKQVEQIAKLLYRVFLISVSSSDREFPVRIYRSGSELSPGRDVHYAKITFVNNGFPINFGGSKFGGGVKEIEPVMALILGSILYLATHQNTELPWGFIPVPDTVTKVLPE